MRNRNLAAKTVGKALDRAFGAPPGEGFLEEQADLLAAYMETRPKGNRWLGRGAVAAAMAAGIAAILAVVYLQRSSVPIPYTIGAVANPSADEWIDNPTAGRLPIRFENGSRIDLFEKSAAQVLESHEKKVLVQLRKGKLFADIKGNGVTRWVVAAGPYRVKVVGTRFFVGWEAEDEVLDVSVTAGKVLVERTDGDNCEVLLEKGKRLHAEARSDQILIEGSRLAEERPEERAPEKSIEDEEATGAAKGTASPSVAVTAPPDDADTRPAPTRTPPAERSRAGSKPAGSAPPWRLMVREKQWNEAVAHADPESIAEMSETADLDALWNLANALRLQRRVREATLLFSALRERFPETSRARTAVFLIGKMRLTLSRNPAGARQWFVRYLREAPEGALREEALGHLMTICRDLGDTTGAKSFATQYLNQYKQGMYHERATAIIGN